jgi:hypothetical protein
MCLNERTLYLLCSHIRPTRPEKRNHCPTFKKTQVRCQSTTGPQQQDRLCPWCKGSQTRLDNQLLGRQSPEKKRKAEVEPAQVDVSGLPHPWDVKLRSWKAPWEKWRLEVGDERESTSRQRRLYEPGDEVGSIKSLDSNSRELKQDDSKKKIKQEAEHD